MLLLSLLLELWTDKIFSLLGKELGSLIRADIIFQHLGVMTMAIILINIDVRDGIVVDMTIQKGDMSFKQKLDCIGVKFCCNRCHQYGHLSKSYSLPFQPSTADHRDVGKD